MIWLISDTHFWHYNIGKYCSRPEGWQNLIIKNWKRLVGDDDDIIHLGDFAWTSRKSTAGRGGKQEVASLVAQLPGRKYLVWGNHDKPNQWMQDVGFEVWPPGTDQFIEDFRFTVLGLGCEDWEDADGIFLSHRPIPRVPFPYFYGHVHNNPMPFDDDRKYYAMNEVLGKNVCVEVCNYQPVPLMYLLGSVKWADAHFPIKRRSYEER